MKVVSLFILSVFLLIFCNVAFGNYVNSKRPPYVRANVVRGPCPKGFVKSRGGACKRLCKYSFKEFVE